MSELFDVILGPATGELEENTTCILAEGTIEGFGRWTLDEEGLLTIDGIGDMPDWDVDNAAPWEAERKLIRSVQISNSVTNIGQSAFITCSNLISITFPTSIKSIHGGAFGECKSLISIDIPSSVTSIGKATFLGCEHLRNICIPNSVSVIGELAFGLCNSLTELHIPKSVCYLGVDTFVGCDNLRRLTMPTSLKVPFYLFKFYYGIPRSIVTFI